MSLFQDLNKDSAKSQEPPKKPTEAQKRAGETHRKVERRLHSKRLRQLYKSDLELMLDEMLAN